MKEIIKKSNNKSVKMENHLPINAITAKINDENNFIVTISDKDFNRYVVVLNESGEVKKALLNTSDDSVKIARDKEYFYVISSTHHNTKLYKFSLSDLSLEETREFPFTDMGSIAVNDDYIYLFDASEGYIYELEKDLKTNNKIDVNEYYQNYHQHSFNYIAATNSGFTYIVLPCSEEEFYEFKAFMYDKFGKTISEENDFIKSVSYDKKNNIGYISFNNFIIIVDKEGIDSILHFKKDSIISVNYDDFDADSLVICFAGNKPLTGNVKVINKDTIDKLKTPVKYKNNKQKKMISTPK